MRQPAAPQPLSGPRRARLGDAAGIGAVQVASWKSTYHGIVPADYLDSMTVEDHSRRWHRLLTQPGNLEMTFVAEERGRIVGFAMGGPEREGDPRFRGELYAIYLVDEAHGRGHGRTLVEAVGGALLQRGYRSMLVWVLRDNLPARRFYEHMGGRYLREHELDFGAGFALPEVSYGWDDVRRDLRLSG